MGQGCGGIGQKAMLSFQLLQTQHIFILDHVINFDGPPSSPLSSKSYQKRNLEEIPFLRCIVLLSVTAMMIYTASSSALGGCDSLHSHPARGIDRLCSAMMGWGVTAPHVAVVVCPIPAQLARRWWVPSSVASQSGHRWYGTQVFLL